MQPNQPPIRDLSPPRLEEELPALPPEVEVQTLPNGLTVIIKEDHSAPVVSVQAWCQSGSIDEGRWLGAGISHLLEHMLFKGTKKRAGERIDQEVQEAGGYMNAYTSFDRTVFYINVPNTGATVAIDILCDIMQSAILPPEELEKEKNVILREMDMNQDDPGRRSSRRLFETAYTRSPYRFTVIGYPDIFSELKPADVLDYYHSKYIPNNIFYVVVGAIQSSEVLAQIAAAYADVKAKPLVISSPLEEPPQMAPRELIEEGSVEMGHFHFCWHIPTLRHPDVPALDVLATLLGSGRSCRLYQRLREVSGLVNHIDAWTYSPGNPGLLGISGLVDPERFERARTAALVEVEKIRQEPVAPEELTKAVKQFISATLSIRKTMQGQAQDLGANWIAARDLNFSERYLASVKRLSPDDLQRVALAYLAPEKRTLYALLPPIGNPKRKNNVSHRREEPVRTAVLSNGLHLLLKEDHRLPFIQFRLVFGGGVHIEDRKNSGLTHLTAKMLLQGTERRSAADLARQIESIGGVLDTYSGNNSFGFTMEVLQEDFSAAAELLQDLILHPLFPTEALEREKKMQLSALLAQKDHLLQQTARNLRRSLFGYQSYGLELLGEEESVSSFGRDDISRFSSRWVVPANAVLAVYGDLSSSEARDLLEKLLSNWQSSHPRFQPASVVPNPLRQALVEDTREKKQGVIVIGFPGAHLHHPRRFALELLQECCSDLGSRLFMRIRERLGLAYFVGAQNFLGLGAGYFTFYAGTEPEKIEQVQREIFEEVALLRQDGPTAAELDRSKAKIIGQKKIARQDLGAVAMTQALDELYGLGFDHSDREDEFYQKVSRQEVIEAAREFLEPSQSVVSISRPAVGSNGTEN